MAKSDADDPVQEDRMVRRLLVGLMAASTEGFTETGTFVAVPLADPSLPTYIGTLVVRNGFFIQNGQNINNTFTYSVHGTGSDGSTFNTHTTLHFNVPPAAPINEFFRCH
jgi:hypothetical protein